MIRISHASKSFGSIKALDNLSLSIPKGSIYGLLGTNGAGKTTLLSILNGVLQPDSAEIEIFGFDLKKDIKEIRKISSTIPQHLAFYEKLSVKENIDLFAAIVKAKKQNIQKAIEINGLEQLLSQSATTLSGGQQRRLNIAIGLLNDPKIIYFDEPTVGIDPRSKNEILDLIKSYRDFGITVVYTSHYMNEIEKICDRVAILKQGRVVVQDTLEKLLYSDERVFIDTVDCQLIQTDKKGLCASLASLDSKGIKVKQIRYGLKDLEKYFLEMTH